MKAFLHSGSCCTLALLVNGTMNGTLVNQMHFIYVVQLIALIELSSSYLDSKGGKRVEFANGWTLNWLLKIDF